MNQNFKKIVEKAKYCLHCKTKPCSNACPLSNNIPEFIEQIKNENIVLLFLHCNGDIKKINGLLKLILYFLCFK